MIFRRRRTRIEIEHTTVRLEAGGVYPLKLGTDVVTPAPPPAQTGRAALTVAPASATGDPSHKESLS